MVQYLSDEWMEAAGEAISKSEALRSAASGDDVSIGYEVTGSPAGKRSYVVWLRGGEAGVEVGASKDVDVSFSLDYPTAVEIAKGDLSAQAAFMQGKMKLGGDVGVLIRGYSAIDGLADALGELRSKTEY